MYSVELFATFVVCFGAFVVLSHGEFVQNRDRVRVRRNRFDWQIPEPTRHPTTTTTLSPSTTTAEPIVVEKINVTSMIIRDGTVQINADDVMHKEEAEGIGDVGLILWGGPGKKSSKQIQITTTTTTSTESNIAKIMDSMPSANEDMIRVVKLKEDEHYGKGWAKPKYISMVLAKMNSTEYKGEATTTTTTSKTSPISDDHVITTYSTNDEITTTEIKSEPTTTTENNHVVMKISKNSNNVNLESTPKTSTTTSSPDISEKDYLNVSSTPIIMGEHMEYSISKST